MIIKTLIKLFEQLLFKVYSATFISRNRSNRIHARITLIELDDLIYFFTKDLKRIKSDYSKQGIVLNTDTHRIFAYHIIKEFISEEIANDFSKRSKKMKINEEISFESNDKSIKIVVTYYTDKVNTNTAIKKLIRFKSIKSDIRNLYKNIKNNSRKIKYFHIKIHIR